MNFSALSIRNPIPAILLFALLTLAGLLAFKANKVQFFPDIELPIVTVTATLDGAAPAQLETEVARKIEDSVATLQGVKNIYTKVLDGVATVTVEFILDKDLSDAVNDVRDGFSYVFRLNPDSRVSQLKISTGRRLGERIEVVGGLAPEAQIVVNGAGFLNDGDLVRNVPAVPAAPAPGAAPAKVAAR